ncbi:YegP family protein [Kitasatospora sp. HPMI-4]|uniref:YegP family protein n=1 Tax=Kitasatospora sp. HPMI-4 TaxID=3448443 RepID=UPI003F1C10E9
MAGKFEVYTEKPGVHRFRLKASNGSVLITSDPHDSKESLMKSIESIRKLAPYAQVQESSASA